MARDLLKDPYVISAVRELLDRAERQTSTERLVATFVDPDGLAARIDNDGNQIIYGRRGTGKTHLLRVLSASRGGLSIYVDMRQVAETPRVGDDQLPRAVRAAALFQILLGRLRDAIAQQLEAGPSDVRRQAEPALRAFEAAISADALVDESVMREQTDSRHAARGDEASVELASSPRFGLRSGWHEASDHGHVVKQEGGRAIARVLFVDVDRRLTELMRAARIERMLLLLDEWVTLPYELQPLVADYVRRAFFANGAVTVKIAAVEHRSNFFELGEGSMRVGFETSADIGTGLALDAVFVYLLNPERVVRAFSELLFRHVAVGAAIAAAEAARPGLWQRVRLRLRPRRGMKPGEDPSSALRRDPHWGSSFFEQVGVAYMRRRFGTGTPEEFVDRLFTSGGRGGGSFHELVHASQGIVRDFIHMFCVAFMEVGQRKGNKIDRPAIRAAAREWHVNDKASNLRGLPDVEGAFRRIVDYVQAHGNTDLFHLDCAIERHPVVESLFDLRVIHLIRRGCALADHPDQRFNEYAIDYGAYVDFLRGPNPHLPGGRGGRPTERGHVLVIPTERLRLPHVRPTEAPVL